MSSKPYHESVSHYKSAIKLLTVGAAHELVETYNLSVPEADIIILQALFSSLDDTANIPTMLFGPVMHAIRAAIEDDWADQVALAGEEAQDAYLKAIGERL